MVEEAFSAERLGLRCATPQGNRAPIVAITLPGSEDAAKAAFAAAIFNTDADVDRAIAVLDRLKRA